MLLDRYGTRADEVLAATPEHDETIALLPGYTAAELAHLAASEQVVHLDDLLLRRTSIAFLGGLTLERVRAAAEAIAPVLNWDGARVDEEIRRMAQLLRTAHRIDVERGGAVVDI